MMTRYNPRQIRQSLLHITLWVTTLTTPLSLYADEPRPYPASSAIETTAISPERRARLESLITAPNDPKIRKKITDQLCPPAITRAEIVTDSVKPVLSVVENSAATEIVFSRPTSDTQTGPTQFSYLVEFFPTQVLLRHGAPRYASEAAGVIAPFPADHTRGVWTEGKLGTDMLVLIPSTRDCSTQAVVLCPRVYQHPDKLVRSSFTPTAARLLYNAKADGLAAAALGTPEAGRVMASIQGSSAVSLPPQWFVVGNDPRNPAATVKHSTRGADGKSPPPFTPTTLPFAITLQSRLDFGTQTAVLRTATRATTVEITELPVRDLNSVQVRNSFFSVEEGTCYLVAQSIATTL